MIGRNAGDIWKEKFFMSKLAWQALVSGLFVSDSWKHSRQVVQQIYLLVNSTTNLLLVVGKSRERSWRKERFAESIHLKRIILYVQTSLASPRFGIICFRQLETFATGSTTNLFVGNFRQGCCKLPKMFKFSKTPSNGK